MDPEEDAMSWKDQGLATRALHAGDPRPRIQGALTIPIFQSTVFEHRTDAQGYHDVRYPRLNNLPNHAALAGKLAALEGGEDALVTSSGMSAITTSLLAVLGHGGHLLVQDRLYGGTHMFVTAHLASFGIQHDPIDAERPESWRDKLRPNTRAIYVEAITNPLVEVADHPAVVAFAREHGLVSMIDNTFATPVNFRPLEHGFDLSLHSATKYLNGHNDLVAGAVIGSRALVQRIRELLNELGGTLDPHACYLLNRGLKTLVLRVREQNANALALARALAGHAAVRAVRYPGLESHRHHARARALFGGYGGMLSFEVAGGLERVARVLERLRLPVPGPSLGGVETLITRPAATSHAGLTPDEQREAGIQPTLLRVSVGIESAEDLVADFLQALD
jgi:cystathionine beta-lyase/cystathionine gamma-synthase